VTTVAAPPDHPIRQDPDQQPTTRGGATSSVYPGANASGDNQQVAAELGSGDVHDLDASLAAADRDAVRGLAWLDPQRSNALTPRDTTTLLRAVWNDEAGPSQACALVRTMMAQQQNTQRLASGFPDEVAVAGKTGTLPTVRNEAGVVTYPDGRSYAISVFTCTESLGDRNAPLDAAIGRAAAIAIAALRPER